MLGFPVNKNTFFFFAAVINSINLFSSVLLDKHLSIPTIKVLIVSLITPPVHADYEVIPS